MDAALFSALLRQKLAGDSLESNGQLVCLGGGRDDGAALMREWVDAFRPELTALGGAVAGVLQFHCGVGAKADRFDRA